MLNCLAGWINGQLSFALNHTGCFLCFLPPLFLLPYWRGRLKEKAGKKWFFASVSIPGNAKDKKSFSFLEDRSMANQSLDMQRTQPQSPSRLPNACLCAELRQNLFGGGLKPNMCILARRPWVAALHWSLRTQIDRIPGRLWLSLMKQIEEESYHVALKTTPRPPTLPHPNPWGKKQFYGAKFGWDGMGFFHGAEVPLEKASLQENWAQICVGHFPRTCPAGVQL